MASYLETDGRLNELELLKKPGEFELKIHFPGFGSAAKFQDYIVHESSMSVASMETSRVRLKDHQAGEIVIRAPFRKIIKLLLVLDRAYQEVKPLIEKEEQVIKTRRRELKERHERVARALGKKPSS